MNYRSVDVLSVIASHFGTELKIEEKQQWKDDRGIG
jgi:hypothetical protein